MIRGHVVDSYPLSPMQQGMLFNSLYAPGSGVDIEQIVTSLPEVLDEEAFARAWTLAITRHASLRTAFRWEGLAEPVQDVYSEVQVPVAREDWRGVPESEQSARLAAYLAAARAGGFQLDVPPLIRLALFRCGDADWRFIWTFHHGLLDGRSFRDLLVEVFASYELLQSGGDPDLPAPRAYRDFIVWQRGQAGSQSESFWREHLAGFARPTPLPNGDLASEVRPGRAYAYCELRLSPERTNSLREFARQHDLTVNTLLQGAWAILLGRYSREEDVIFGATRAGRRSALPPGGADGMIGLFINTLPVRARLDHDLQLLPWLHRLRAQSIALRDYEHTALVDVQRWSELPAGSPLFATLLVYEDYLLDTALRALGGPWVNRRFTVYDQTNYPLTLAAYADTSMLLRLQYDCDRFDDTMPGRLLEHLATVLDGMLAQPHGRIGDISMLTEAERLQVLVEWNATEADYPRDRCLHDLFEEQAGRTPAAVAVVAGSARLTYSELNARSDRLAHHLRDLGVGPDTAVGMCIERSPEMLVGLLAILKAGGAYLPLDPAHPPARLAFMLEDSATPVLLTNSRHRAALPPHGGHLVCIDEDWHYSDFGAAPRLPRVTGPEHLAYVIYTSGSTGRPKGVMIPHRAAVNYVWWARQAYGAESGAGSPVQSSIGFDLTVTSLFVPLLAGRPVILLPESEGVESLSNAILRTRDLTLVKLTPAHMALLSQQLPARDVAGRVRCLVIGGEQLSGDNLSFWQTNAPATRLINEYGPTETTVGCCAYEVPQGKRISGAVPIGRPIANTRLYVLDPYGQPVPAGVPGELYIGGDGVARGYLNRPELTAERFVPDPFTPVRSQRPARARLYRTGDLVRHLPDGNLEFLGRVDDQVKIRGYRVEPGEVEDALGSHPGVGQSSVVAREDRPGDRQLVAYFVPRGDPGPSPAELRLYLRERLPDYEVPTAFVSLPALPLTRNGKVDRSALPAPAQVSFEPPEDHVAPRDGLEEVMAGLWGEVLGVQRVGIHDSFFEMGGHSLSATQLMARVQAVFHVRLPLRVLFDSPTVAGLVRSVGQGHGTPVPAIARMPHSGPQPLSFAQERLWFLHQLGPARPAYNVPLALRLHGSLDTGALESALDEIVRRHEILRATFPIVDGAPRQVIGRPEFLTLPHVDLRGRRGGDHAEEALRQAAEEARQPFDLARGPLLRVRLWQIADADHLLLLVLHHIISDGWSLGIMQRELGILYAAYHAGEPSPLPDPALQYVDFARWQRDWLRGEVLQSRLAYWTRKLAGYEGIVQLPLDCTRPPVQSHGGGRCRVSIPPEIAQQLLALSRREGATLFMTLLAAFMTLLHRYNGQNDVLVGTPMANRHWSELEDMPGMFVNTLALRVDLGREPTFRELLSRVRETTIDAYTHQDLPFEQLVEATHPARDLSHQPVFQVMFALQNQPPAPREFAGLQVVAEEISTDTAKFDLTLDLKESSGSGLTGFLEYNADLFDGETIDRMAAHYVELLTGIAAHPDWKIAELPLLTDSERQQLLVEWNATARDFGPERCLHQLVEEQVTLTPDAVAVVAPEGRLTYAEINARANQLAHRLRSLGIGPNSLVGICMERSLEMVVGLLGILKAGAAYVPLDPTYPIARLAFMLEDSRVAVTVAQPHLARLLPANTNLLLLDGGWTALAEASTANVESQSAPDDLAYVIYTSGSTGKPKGAMITHRGIWNRLLWMQETFALSPDDRVLQKTPFAFDVSVWEFFWPLLAGARLVMARPDGHRDPSYLAQLIRAEGITTLHFVPSMLALFLEEPTAGELPSLQRVICSGEALPFELQQRFFKRLDCGLYNLYGPTEAAIDVTWWSCRADYGPPVVPIGRPIANTQIYLVDARFQPVPVGVPGELCIGGYGLARGYLNRRGLTAERFVANPFYDGLDRGSLRPGARLYRTGDMARYLPDGSIEFLGRMDQQIKIRGFRIEPGEIEAALTQHPAVQASAVSAHEVSPGDRRLAAYLALRPGAPADPGEIREFLHNQLPDYMVPAAFVFVDALPLLPNGKLDIQRLPAPDWGHSPAGPAIVTPHDVIEDQLVSLWQDLLGTGHVGVTDNFFDLGGHSLLAVRMMARIKSHFARTLPLATLFRSPTIAGLAEVLRMPEPNSGWSPLVPIHPGGAGLPFFCVHPAGGNVLTYAELARQLDPARPFYGLQSVGLENGAAPQERIEDMAATYLVALKTVQPAGPYLLGGWSLGGVVAFEMARQLSAAREQVGLVALIDSWTPTELARMAEPPTHPPHVLGFQDAELLAGLMADIAGASGQATPISADDLRARPPGERLAYCLAQAQALSILPADVGVEQLTHLLQVFSANLGAMYAYHPGSYSGRVVLFRAAGAETEAPSDHGWQRLLRQKLKIRDLPGDHFSALASPNVAVLAGLLAAALAAAEEDREDA